MNHLNSILLEGNLENEPKLTAIDGLAPICSFNLASERYSRTDEEFEKHTSVISVRVNGRLAECCSSQLTQGRGVRVVGRIKQEDEIGVYIIAEHVEFKPVFK